MTNRRGQSVALEGPSLAGKTTLGRGLIGDFSGLTVAYVNDYSDHVGGGRFLPPPVPSSVTEEERTLNAFLVIEAERTEHLRPLSSDLILIDRSVYTLLAHCNALERMTGVPYGTVAQRILTQSTIPVWPDLVLYLDIPTETINDRNKGKFALDSIFVDAEFNAGIRSYFKQLANAVPPTVAWLDATLDRLELRRLAKAHAQELL